jgi:hypothetical protein
VTKSWGSSDILKTPGSVSVTKPLIQEIDWTKFQRIARERPALINQARRELEADLARRIPLAQVRTLEERVFALAELTAAGTSKGREKIAGAVDKKIEIAIAAVRAECTAKPSKRSAKLAHFADIIRTALKAANYPGDETNETIGRWTAKVRKELRPRK